MRSYMWSCNIPFNDICLQLPMLNVHDWTLYLLVIWPYDLMKRWKNHRG